MPKHCQLCERALGWFFVCDTEISHKRGRLAEAWANICDIGPQVTKHCTGSVYYLVNQDIELTCMSVQRWASISNIDTAMNVLYRQTYLTQNAWYVEGVH